MVSGSAPSHPLQDGELLAQRAINAAVARSHGMVARDLSHGLRVQMATDLPERIHADWSAVDEGVCAAMLMIRAVDSAFAPHRLAGAAV